ncbi:MAG: hypothetical protein GY859_43860 [Desulfobacterales bacterium]|nr:hypothetical protein [Desulfobacterales bacterium]
MKKIERDASRLIIAAGVSSVAAQLLTIREFMAQFQGNEIIIALILTIWLILGGVGTLLAHGISHRFFRPSPGRLGGISLALAVLPAIQLLAIRASRDLVFVHGSSVGFYPTLAYTFLMIAPYSLLIGFALPYSLFVLRTTRPDYPGARVYITDNIGDVAGGALFAFVLVHLTTPLQAVLLTALPLLAASGLLFHHIRRLFPWGAAAAAAALLLLLAATFVETASLAPARGALAYYGESRYGRIRILEDHGQYTLFGDGIPFFSNQNIGMAEETIHYPLSQVEAPKNVLILSAEAGMLAEVEKHAPDRVDYVELNPEVTDVLFRFGLLREIPGLHIIHRDGRAFLAETDRVYDAIILNMPEPDTFQLNRFYTDRFFAMARARLSPRGVLGFSMRGFDNYLAEPQRRKLSSLYNTVTRHFRHALLLPGQKVFFICGDAPIRSDIPALLKEKGVASRYIEGYFYGNLTPERIRGLNQRLDPAAAINVDLSPYLTRLMFRQWFAKFASSPAAFAGGLCALALLYLVRVNREEFVLFSTGCASMGCEILVIFAFQIFYGYIYVQIGVIVTVFLAGLAPGAFLGHRFEKFGKKTLVLTDGALILLLALFILVVMRMEDGPPAVFFYLFGFLVSMVCGSQFPAALSLRGGDNPAAAGAFSADLMGAALGAMVVSLILIPYFGLLWAAAGLMALKAASLLLIR